MSQQTQHPQTATSEFDAAKVIVETLKGLESQQQIRAIRFACESLGVQAPASIQTTVAPQHQQPSAGSLASPVGAVHSMDIQQFTAAKAPKSDQQFSAVVAYFYRFEAPEGQRKDAIDADILQEAARLARRKRPAKPGMTLNNAKNAGYLDPAGNGQFKLSTVGENLVAMTLPGTDSESPAKVGRAKKKVAKKKPHGKKAATGGR